MAIFQNILTIRHGSVVTSVTAFGLLAFDRRAFEGRTADLEGDLVGGVAVVPSTIEPILTFKAASDPKIVVMGVSGNILNEHLLTSLSFSLYLYKLIISLYESDKHPLIITLKLRFGTIIARKKN